MNRENWKELLEVVEGFRGRKVGVLGDLVLDRFWYGHVQRVSREAPVPVVRLSQTRYLMGCAANTISNLAAFGAVPHPVGVVGTDGGGDSLLRLTEEMGVTLDGILQDPDWVTPTKTRILAGSPHGSKQQLVRVDSGESNHYSAALVEGLKSALDAALPRCEALVLSDYGYGILDAVEVTKTFGGVPCVALDSRFALTSYPGVTTATPNEEEFEGAVGPESTRDPETFEREAESLRARLRMKALLVTRGKRGMSLFEEGRRPLHIPVVGPAQVVDVTGAGDTVMASYVLSLCCGASYSTAAQIADIAGGIVVQKHGTATTSVGELSDRVRLWGEGRV